MSRLWLVRDRRQTGQDEPIQYLAHAATAADAHRIVVELRREQFETDHPGGDDVAYRTYFGSPDPDADVQVPLELDGSVYLVGDVQDRTYDLVGEDQA